MRVVSGLLGDPCGGRPCRSGRRWVFGCGSGCCGSAPASPTPASSSGTTGRRSCASTARGCGDEVVLILACTSSLSWCNFLGSCVAIALHVVADDSRIMSGSDTGGCQWRRLSGWLGGIWWAGRRSVNRESSWGRLGIWTEAI